MLITKFSIGDIESKVEEFENRMGILLPDEYKKFLLRYNGGITVNTSFRINKVSSDIVGFYGLGNIDDAFSFKQIEQLGIIKDFIEKGFLPIAYNDFGDIIAIGMREENKGKIYFIYHDKDKIVLLADEFNQFIGKCKSEKVGYIPSIEERKNMMIENGLGDKITENTIKGWQEEIDEYKNICQEKVIV